MTPLGVTIDLHLKPLAPPLSRWGTSAERDLARLSFSSQEVPLVTL